MFSSYRPILIDINEIPNTWNLYYTYIITFIDVLASTRNSSITQLDKDGVRIAFLLLSPSWRFSILRQGIRLILIRLPDQLIIIRFSKKFYQNIPSQKKKKRSKASKHRLLTYCGDRAAGTWSSHPSIHPSGRPSTREGVCIVVTWNREREKKKTNEINRQSSSRDIESLLTYKRDIQLE